MLIFILFTLFFQPIYTDLPVHCLAKHIEGIWNLYLGPNNNENVQTCGHNRPDQNTDHIYKDLRLDFLISNELIFNLKLPNIVLDKEDKQIGTWSMIYDEGFEIRALDQIFFSFSYYKFNGKNTPKDEDDENTEGYQNMCNETFLGWYYNDKNNNNHGCYYGIQKSSINNIKYENIKNQNSEKIVEHVLNPELSLYERFKQKLPLYDLPHPQLFPIEKTEEIEDEDKLFQPDFSFIEFVNKVGNSPWKAKNHDHFINKTERHMKNLLGLTRFREFKMQYSLLNQLNSDQQLDFYDPIEESSFLQFNEKTKKKNSIFLKSSDSKIFHKNEERKEFPSFFDWRNNQNSNYDTPVEHQGECGSCYAVAALSSIESRIRIRTNNKSTPKLSLSMSLQCSRYNQGCNGGYPELIGKFGKEEGFYEDSCFPSGFHNLNCDINCLNSSRWKIKDYGYVGKGYYGSTSEETMMREIINNGPIVVAINAAPDLYYYSSGVFITNPKNSISQENNNPEIRPWQFTNHAVVCVGWGETEHEGNLLKYWILKNSWGKEWGENGYFKMLKGVNLGSVENQAIFIEPLINESNFKES